MIAHIFSEILQPIKTWIKDWQNNLPEDVTQIFIMLFDTKKTNEEMKSLRDLFEKFDKKNKKQTNL